MSGIERIYHTWDKWECYPAGFYSNRHLTKTDEECRADYADFLRDIPAFEAALEAVITEWRNSCEHYLTNVAMNRIAWLGQASACYALGIPAIYRAGFHLLTEKQQAEANELALEFLNRWLVTNGRKPVTMEEATSDRQSDIY